MAKKGLLVVISAPSGGGKTSILGKVIEQGKQDFRYSISATTRPKRAGEVEGHDYFFLSLGEFTEKRDNGEFVEWAEVHGHFYATPRATINKWLLENKIVLCDLDVDGGLAVKKEFGKSALLIFIRPPSYQSLVERLKARNTESDSEIEKRLQRYPKEMDLAQHYDHQIVNEDLQDTVKEVLTIIEQTMVST